MTRVCAASAGRPATGWSVPAPQRSPGRRVAGELAFASRSATFWIAERLLAGRRPEPGNEVNNVSEQLDENLQEFLEIRQPGVDYEEHARDDFALQIGVDLANFKKFPRVDDSVTYKKVGHDVRGELGRIRAPSSPTTAGRSRPISVSPTSRTTRSYACSGMSYAYYRLLVEAWAGGARSPARARTRWKRSRHRRGPTGSSRTSSGSRASGSAFDDVDQMPELERRCRCTSVRSSRIRATRSATRSGSSTCSSAVTSSCCSCIEAWAAEVVVRYSLDEMFDIQWALWSDKVLPEVRNIKGR